MLKITQHNYQCCNFLPTYNCFKIRKNDPQQNPMKVLLGNLCLALLQSFSMTQKKLQVLLNQESRKSWSVAIPGEARWNVRGKGKGDVHCAQAEQQQHSKCLTSQAQLPHHQSFIMLLAWFSTRTVGELPLNALQFWERLISL